MAGIALKGQADLISIMVPLKVQVYQKKKNRKVYTAAVISTKNSLCNGKIVGRDEEALMRTLCKGSIV